MRKAMSSLPGSERKTNEKGQARRRQVCGGLTGDGCVALFVFCERKLRVIGHIHITGGDQYFSESSVGDQKKARTAAGQSDQARRAHQ